MALRLAEHFGADGGLAGLAALLIENGGGLAAEGGLGQQDVGVGAVGPGGEGLVGQGHSARLVRLLVSLLQERLGLALRRVLMEGASLDASHHPTHGAFEPAGRAGRAGRQAASADRDASAFRPPASVFSWPWELLRDAGAPAL